MEQIIDWLRAFQSKRRRKRGKKPCLTFWGGHGCDLHDGHRGQHWCNHYEAGGVRPTGDMEVWRAERINGNFVRIEEPGGNS